MPICDFVALSPHARRYRFGGGGGMADGLSILRTDLSLSCLSVRHVICRVFRLLSVCWGRVYPGGPVEGLDPDQSGSQSVSQLQVLGVSM